MAASRDFIISEIKRTAEENGGIPLGTQAFSKQTDIKASDWYGLYWARWGDALQEAGYNPNTLRKATDDLVLLKSFASLALELGHVPVMGELRLQRKKDSSFPSHSTFSRWGSKQQLLNRLLQYCNLEIKFSSLVPLIQAELKSDDKSPKLPLAKEITDGYVYLARMGKHFKIGKTFCVPRRHQEIALELPEKLVQVHVIRTDDPSGIEAYWHKRFADKRTNGEWFSLSAEDIRIFRKRKFM